jgi:hypothetical protein
MGLFHSYADATLRDSPPTNQTSNHWNGEEHDRYKENDLGSLNGDTGDTAKAKQCSNECNNQKGNGPTQHGGPPCFYGGTAAACRSNVRLTQLFRIVLGSLALASCQRREPAQ